MSDHPAAEVSVYVAPDFQQIGFNTLVNHSSAVAALVARLTALEAAMPPANVTVPHASQTGDALNCTMGNWTGEPTSYAYQWQIDGTDAGTDSPDYTPGAGDVGKSATCVVTATNAAGAGTAPPSNAVVVSGAG